MKHPHVNGEPILVGDWVDVVESEFRRDSKRSGVVVEIRLIPPPGDSQGEVWIATNTGRNEILTEDMILGRRSLEDGEREELIQAEYARWTEKYGA